MYFFVLFTRYDQILYRVNPRFKEIFYREILSWAIVYTQNTRTMHARYTHDTRKKRPHDVKRPDSSTVFLCVVFEIFEFEVSAITLYGNATNIYGIS